MGPNLTRLFAESKRDPLACAELGMLLLDHGEALGEALEQARIILNNITVECEGQRYNSFKQGVPLEGVQQIIDQLTNLAAAIEKDAGGL
jgi:hypothetical protein